MTSEMIESVPIVYHPYTQRRTIKEREIAMKTNFRHVEAAKIENYLRMQECREAYNGYADELLKRGDYSNFRTALHTMRIPYKKCGEIWVHAWDYRNWASPLDVASATHETMWMAELPNVPPMLGIQICLQENLKLSQGDEARKEIILLTMPRELEEMNEMEEIKAEVEFKKVVETMTDQMDPEWLALD